MLHLHVAKCKCTWLDVLILLMYCCIMKGIWSLLLGSWSAGASSQAVLSPSMLICFRWLHLHKCWGDNTGHCDILFIYWLSGEQLTVATWFRFHWKLWPAHSPDWIALCSTKCYKCAHLSLEYTINVMSIYLCIHIFMGNWHRQPPHWGA